MIKKTKPNRYILFQNGIAIKELPTKVSIANEVGCTLDWIYKAIDEDGNFPYQKNNYQMVDKLELI